MITRCVCCNDDLNEDCISCDCGKSWCSKECAKWYDYQDKKSTSSCKFCRKNDMLCFVIENVIRISGKGTALIGKVLAPIKIDDKLKIVTEENVYPRTVVGIDKFNKTLQSAEEGETVAILFREISKFLDIKKGCTIEKDS